MLSAHIYTEMQTDRQITHAHSHSVLQNPRKKMLESYVRALLQSISLEVISRLEFLNASTGVWFRNRQIRPLHVTVGRQLHRQVRVRRRRGEREAVWLRRLQPELT